MASSRKTNGREVVLGAVTSGFGVGTDRTAMSDDGSSLTVMLPLLLLAVMSLLKRSRQKIIRMNSLKTTCSKLVAAETHKDSRHTVQRYTNNFILMKRTRDEKKRTESQISTGNMNTDEDMAVWLTTLRNRVVKQIEKYTKYRKMLIPIRYTGSLEDLRSIALRTTLPGQKASPRLLSTILTSFNIDELNEWCRQFQEYWMQMLAAYTELKRRAADPTASLESNSDEDQERLNFLTNNDAPYLRLAVETMLSIFERDRLPWPEYNRQSEVKIINELKSRLTAGNSYLGRRIVERPDLIVKR